MITVLFALTVRDVWWMRTFDYLRLQITLVSIVVLLLSLLLFHWRRWWSVLYLTLLGLAVAYQLIILAPYWLPVQPAVPARSTTASERTFSLLSANVLMENRDVAAFLALVERYDPDLLLVIEPNRWWIEQLQPLRTRYPHHVEQPQDNHYGMAFYSRFPLRATEIAYFEENNIPSIYTVVQLPAGDEVIFYGEHPRPPLPENSVTLADKELLKVAERARVADRPVVVAGDFNDVPWSYTMETFAEISGLRDIRIGRGFYNTFDAQNPILRLPIDHIYLSPGLGLVELADPIPFSSDHFALFARLVVDESVQ
jgi:endonuclease/exonuclease/phosphatase (EEP) superfamily protein YafD